MILDFFNTLNFDLVAVGTAIAAIAVLGIAVFLADRSNLTNQTFFLFAIVIIIYATVNYLSYRVTDTMATIWLLRGIIFFATWASFLLFQFFYVFPQKTLQFKNFYRFGIIPYTAFVSILTLTPLVFSGVKQFAIGGEPAVAELGPAMPVFGLTSAFLVTGAIFLLVRKWLKAQEGLFKRQILFILIGSTITFAGILIFNVALPLIFENTRYLVFAPVWFFPFIAFTAYSILHYRLFDVKMAAVSILSFFLAVTVIFQVIFSQGLDQVLFGISQFILIIVFSAWLLQATLKEVQQREEIQILAESLKKANERLKELDKLKSQFLSIASHDLRAPLTTIRNFMSLLLDGTYGKIPQAAEEGMHQVFERATEMAKSVDDYLNVSRIEQGRMKYDFAETDLVKIVSDTTSLFKPIAEKKSLSFTFRGPADLKPIFIKGDIGKLQEIFNNLVDNSIKYTPKGSISVSLEILDKVARVTIKDTGIGMSQETIKNKLFKLFSTGDDSRKVNTSSTGVGLFITKAHVEAHKGKLLAESEGEGKGSIFIVELPILDKA